MLEIEFKEAALLKRIVQSIKDLTNDVGFLCNPSGIELQCMDESHVALVSLHLSSKTLARYKCTSECLLGISLPLFHKLVNPFANSSPLIMKKVDGESFLTLIGTSVVSTTQSGSPTDKDKQFNDNEIQQDEDQIMQTSMEDQKLENLSSKRVRSSKVECNRTATVKLINVERELYTIPQDESQYKAQITLPPAILMHAIRSNINVSETIKVTVKSQTLEFATDGDMGYTSMVIKKGQGDIRNSMEFPWIYRASRSDEGIEMEFGLAYLQKFTKACALTNKLSLDLSSSVPLRVKFPIDAHSNITFYLAPKLDDDE